MSDEAVAVVELDAADLDVGRLQPDEDPTRQLPAPRRRKER